MTCGAHKKAFCSATTKDHKSRNVRLLEIFLSLTLAGPSSGPIALQSHYDDVASGVSSCDLLFL